MMEDATKAFHQLDLEKERSVSPVPTSASFSSEHSFEDSGIVVVDTSSTETSTTCSSSSSKYEDADFCLNPPPLRRNAWQQADVTTFHVRTQNYLKDAIKSPSEPAVMDLLTVDLVKTSQPLFKTGGLCSHPTERIQQALAQERVTGLKELPAFIFCVNLCIPAKQQGTYYHWAAYFGTDNVSQLRDPTTALGRVTEPFFFGDCDEYRNRTFKLIPRIVKGNFVVRKAVGSKPSILGTKLKHYYNRSDRFLELIVDIGSEKVANRIVKLALGYAKTLVVDMMFLVEGQQEETLPERILGGVRLSELDFKQKDGQRFCLAP